MEAINGVTFKDYACASANIVAGMPTEKVCEVLGLELPVWEDTKDQWNNKMAELTHEDMAFYGAVFTNPKQGKFANVEGAASADDAIAKVKDIDMFAKVFEHIAAAENHGVDSMAMIEAEYGLNMVEWSSASSHWSKVLSKSTDDIEIYNEYFVPHGEASEKYKKHFAAFYKTGSPSLSSDIEF